MFLRYLNTKDESKLSEVKEKASLIGCSRMIRKMRKGNELSEKNRKLIDKYMIKLKELTDKLDTLAF